MEALLTTCHQGKQGIDVQLYYFFNLSAKCGWVVIVTPLPVYLRQRHAISIVHKVRWATGSAWKCAKILAPTAIGYPDRRDYTASLYRLHYAGPQQFSLALSEESIMFQELTL